MLSVAEAQQIILQHVRPSPPVPVALDTAALGLVLAEEVISDLDLPPFDKALMDGYGIRSADLASGRGRFAVIEEVTAGRAPRLPLGADQATRIMTGAPIPPECDAVVMVERTKALEDNRIEIDDRPATPGQNILRRGREMRRGETVLGAGAALRPQEFGILASVGRTSVRVHPAPTVAILPTGDEIVEPDQVPGPGQIRNGNAYMLLGQAVRAGGMPQLIGIARDNVESLRTLIQQGLQADVLVLSGGVSAGKLDLVPGVLAELGVEAHFHKVAMKPGKPMLFGTTVGARSASKGEAVPSLARRALTAVFGLPGNPVSSLVCFELFVRPAIRRLRGHADAGPEMVSASLLEDYPYRSDRPTYHPAQLFAAADRGWIVKPVPWFGSPDLRGVLAANAFVVLPAGEHNHRAGEMFQVLKVEG
jgi:molybdopterin molybdotransferase